MREVDTLRTLTLGELMRLWRTYRARCRDPLERAVLCNAGILARCCYCGGEAVYRNEGEVLRDMTPREMEKMIRRLAEETPRAESENPAFDLFRFSELKGE
ncbi:MAG: hypothetical protein IKN53_06500 [Oscillibacter sp.]|nr:hypothetical protein [Oscillibacter sp.]